MTKMGKFKIVNTQILVEWNDRPKLVRLDNEMPTHLQEAYDDWLSSIEHERNCVEFADTDLRDDVEFLGVKAVLKDQIKENT